MITLDLRANTRLRKLKDHVRKIKSKGSQSHLHVLKSAVIYGANASGKSNLIKAISYMQDFVLHGSENNEIKRNTFKFNKEEKPSNFYIEFIQSNVRIGYMFQIDDKRVIYEKLLTIMGHKDMTVFERLYNYDNESYDINSDIDFSKDDESNKVLAEFHTLADFCPENKLLITEINEKNNKVLENKLKQFSYIFILVSSFFKYKLVTIFPNTKYSALGRDITKEKHRKDYVEILNKFDTGVSDLGTISVNRNMFPESLIASIDNRVLKSQREFILFTYQGEEYYASYNNENSSTEYYSVISKHKNSDGMEKEFYLHEESDGTIRLLDLIPVIEADQRNDARVFIIDEFDRSLHPNLSKSYIKLFMEKTIDNNDQLIVTTHQSELLDYNLIRRDEVWFAQKEKDQSTQIYTLNEFRTNSILDLKNAYLDGKFGGIPFIKQ